MKVYWVSQWLGLRFEGWAGLLISLPTVLAVLAKDGIRG